MHQLRSYSIRCAACPSRMGRITVPRGITPQEDVSPRWRTSVKAFHKQVAQTCFDGPTPPRFSAFWGHRNESVQEPMVYESSQIVALVSDALPLMIAQAACC